MDAVFQLGSHESRVEGQSVGYAFLGATQDIVGLFGCKCAFPAHVESCINHHPQILFLRADLKPFSAQPLSVGVEISRKGAEMTLRMHAAALKWEVF